MNESSIVPGVIYKTEDLWKLRSAARALSQQTKKHLLPEKRRRELEEFVLQHYPEHNEITEELLDEASNCEVLSENPDYESHGLKVLEYYLEQDGGLLGLEQLWRDHFLKTMKPQYLPALWSTTHNEQRLRIRWNEGRLSEEEMKQIGLKW